MKMKVNGQDVDVVPVGFSSLGEPWVEYHLEDGSVARVKAIVTKIFMATEMKGEDGNPVYTFQSQLVAVIDEKT